MAKLGGGFTTNTFAYFSTSSDEGVTRNIRVMRREKVYLDYTGNDINMFQKMLLIVVFHENDFHDVHLGMISIFVSPECF